MIWILVMISFTTPEPDVILLANDSKAECLTLKGQMEAVHFGEDLYIECKGAIR